MEINPCCEYYKHRSIKSNDVRISINTGPFMLVHECHHPHNLQNMVATIFCNIENHYCPYNPTK